MSKQVAVAWPAHYEDARIYIWGFGVYASGTAALAICKPHIVFKLVEPPLYVADKYLGIAPVHPPVTIEEFRANAFAWAFVFAIGGIYLVFGGPFWNRGGKMLLEAGLFTRLIYVVTVYALCFFTEYGTNLAFVVATSDLLSVLLTKRALKASWVDLIFGRKVKQVPVGNSSR
ncbi:unnamed protein product [Somion occarium]|uniref:Uncharacterized protein n=1 Tax=Somion occarium TaxID=3059160 RepID=A0ABP1DIS5_9APHY